MRKEQSKQIIYSIFSAYNVTNSNLHKGCSFYNPAPAGKTCEVDLKSFEPCIKEKSFELFQSQPCVFLKLKKQADWVPRFFNESRLPEIMPSDLQQIIKNYVKNDKKNAVNFKKSQKLKMF